MFTGIIEQIGSIEKIDRNLFTISHDFEKIKIGESIALSGMCATVIKYTSKTFVVEIMEESRDKTIFGDIKTKETINLERSAIIGDRNSGHFVSGHIDEVGRILKLEKIKDFYLFRIKFSQKNSRLTVKKGSIAIDGISLTISDLGKDWIEVSIISHTWKTTNLSTKKIGDSVNIEFDILGKYLNKDKKI